MIRVDKVPCVSVTNEKAIGMFCHTRVTAEERSQRIEIARCSGWLRNRLCVLRL